MGSGLDYTIGYADAAKKIKATPDHIYTLASVTKSITGAVIIDLVQKNYLSLHDSAFKFIKDFPKDITVLDLLNHTSGFLRDKANEHFLDPSSYKNVIDYPPVKFKNKIHRYANYNYAALGKIIEEVTGKPFSFIVKNYFAQITHDSLYFSNHKVNKGNSRIVKNYVRRYRRQILHEPVDFGLWEPAAFAQCSARSFATFLRHHMNPAFIQFISEHAVVISKRRYRNGRTVKECYALGFRLRYENDELKYVYHNGFLYGVLSTFYYFPKKDMGFVALSNMSSYPKRTLSLNGISRIVAKIVDESFTRDVINYTVNNGYLKGAVYYETNKYKGELLESMIDKSAQKFLRKNKINEAISLLKLNNYAFPKSAKTYESLGKAYFQTCYDELAIEVLKRGLEINPYMTSSIKLLDKLKGD